jgi:hypothetical protein
MAIDDPQGIRWDCRPCLPLDPFGENSPLSEANLLVCPRVRGFADFYQRFFR